MANRSPNTVHRATESSRKATSDVTRSKLLEAAGEIFGEVGYHRATTRDICARAGVSAALINYHFGDKLELYSEVLQSLLSAARIDEVGAALSQKAHPEQVLRDAIKARLRGVLSVDGAGALSRILAHEIAQPTPAMIHIINEVSRPMYNQLCEIAGSLLGLPADSEKSRLCANSVLGQVILYVLAGPYLVRLWPELKMTPEQMDRIAGHIADFSLAWLRQAHGDQHQANERRE